MDKRNGNSLLAGPAACALCEVRGLLGMKQPNRRRGPIINPSSASSNVLLARVVQLDQLGRTVPRPLVALGTIQSPNAYRCTLTISEEAFL